MRPLFPSPEPAITHAAGYVDKPLTSPWTRDAVPQGRIDPMYLLLTAHADGAALQELTADGAPTPGAPSPRVVSAAELAGVVRELEQRRPRWIWHRTQDWYPALLASGVELVRCYDLTLCGAILAHSEFTAHTAYAQNAEKLTQDDELQQPPRALQPPPPPADQGALFDDPGLRKAPRHSPEDLRA